MIAWLAGLFGTKHTLLQRRRRKICFRLEALGFQRFAESGEWISGRDQFVKSGWLYDLLGPSKRMIEALYKEPHGRPWILGYLIYSQILRLFDPQLALTKKSDLDCPAPTLPDQHRVGTDNSRDPLPISEEFSPEGYIVRIGDRSWPIWDHSIQPEARCLLERQAFLLICNDLLASRNVPERVWHCWGEKGESLYLFMTPKHCRYIQQMCPNDGIGPSVQEHPDVVLEWEDSE